jgi:ATP-dependent RNA helicase DDX35
MSTRFWRPDGGKTPSPESATVGGPRNCWSDPHPNVAAGDTIRDLRLHMLHFLETTGVLVLTSDVVTVDVCQILRLIGDGGWFDEGLAVAVALPRQLSVLASVEQVRVMRHLRADEVGGPEVGYSLHSETHRSSQTKIVFFTFSSLLTAMRGDPMLSRVAVVIVDVTVNRPVQADILIGLLKMIRTIRASLRVIVFSSVGDCENFISFFGEAFSRRLNVPVETYAVEVKYCAEPVSDYIAVAVDTVKTIHREWTLSGCPVASDILIFVPATEAIVSVCNRIAELAIATRGPQRSAKTQEARTHDKGGIYACPLHGALSIPDQKHALESCEAGKQKVVVSTNVAEAALRVGGIATVIDTGLEFVRLYDSRSYSYRATLCPISKASALNRSRRAGLVHQGKCFRLYTKSDFEELCPPLRAPEVLRVDLSDAAFILKSLGADTAAFRFPTPPPSESLAKALSRLHALGTILPDGRLTSVGHRIATLALRPNLARALITAESRGVATHVCAALAMLDVSQALFANPSSRREAWKLFAVGEGDLLSLLNVYRRYIDHNRSPTWCKSHGLNVAALNRAHKICRGNIRRLRKGQVAPEALAVDDDLSLATRVSRALATCFFETIAVVQPSGNTYRLLTSNVLATIHPSSVLAGRSPRWIVAAEVLRSNCVQLQNVTVVQPQWLAQDIPTVFEDLGAPRGDASPDSSEQ